jgi:hypothetical protein
MVKKIGNAANATTKLSLAFSANAPQVIQSSRPTFETRSQGGFHFSLKIAQFSIGQIGDYSIDLGQYDDPLKYPYGGRQINIWQRSARRKK